MSKLKWFLLGVGLLVSSAGLVQAGAIFNNGSPNLDNSHRSDFDSSTSTNTQILGDDFTLSVADVVRDVHWFGDYPSDNTPPVMDNFTIRFFNFTGQTPNANPFCAIPVGHVTRTDTGLSSGFDVYQYDAVIPDTPLAPGKYLLSIVNNTVGTPSDWYWCDSNVAGNAFERDADTLPWTLFTDYDGAEMAFYLTNDQVAEPSASVLLGIGAIGVLAYRWRRRKRS